MERATSTQQSVEVHPVLVCSLSNNVRISASCTFEKVYVTSLVALDPGSHLVAVVLEELVREDGPYHGHHRGPCPCLHDNPDHDPFLNHGYRA
jgi:hypothetical protein